MLYWMLSSRFTEMEQHPAGRAEGCRVAVSRWRENERRLIFKGKGRWRKERESERTRQRRRGQLVSEQRLNFRTPVRKGDMREVGLDPELTSRFGEDLKETLTHQDQRTTVISIDIQPTKAQRGAGSHFVLCRTVAVAVVHPFLSPPLLFPFFLTTFFSPLPLHEHDSNDIE
jgi:hypothetical protein